MRKRKSARERLFNECAGSARTMNGLLVLYVANLWQSMTLLEGLAGQNSRMMLLSNETFGPAGIVRGSAERQH
jgi:hypothetical protein